MAVDLGDLGAASGAAQPKKRPPRITEQADATNGIAAVDCCKITIIGNTQRFTCKHPGCAREYASRDAVRKHCRIRHLAWLRGLTRTSAREVEFVHTPELTSTPLGSLLSPLLTPPLNPLSTPGMSPTTQMMGSLEINNVPPLELNNDGENAAPQAMVTQDKTPPSPEFLSGLDALVNGGYLLSALNTLSTLAAEKAAPTTVINENMLPRVVPVSAS